MYKIEDYVAMSDEDLEQMLEDDYYQLLDKLKDIKNSVVKIKNENVNILNLNEDMIDWLADNNKKRLFSLCHELFKAFITCERLLCVYDINAGLALSYFDTTLRTSEYTLQKGYAIFEYLESVVEDTSSDEIVELCKEVCLSCVVRAEVILETLSDEALKKSKTYLS